jgi:zinc D-Ala-D-Ala dipeptidase
MNQAPAAVRHPLRRLACATILTIAATAPVLGQSTLPSTFVYLRDIDPTIAQDIRYASQDNFAGRPLPGYGAAECILTRPAAAALKLVQADLAASGLALKVYDCYRPARATRAMVQWALDGRAENRRFYPRLAKPSLLSGYIASHSRHATGTAIDLTLVDTARPAPAAFDPRASYGPCIGPAAQRAPDSSLDMGTGYDCFDGMSHTNTAAISPEQRRRRTQLVSAMNRRGFRNYHREWWHFTFSGTSGVAAAYDVPIAPRRGDAGR